MTEVVDPLPPLVIAWSLAALFVAAVVHKLRALAEWPGVVANYRLFPAVLAAPVAVALLVGEAATAVALAWAPALGGAAAAVMLLAYAAALGINLGRGRTRIDCGCFASRLSQGIAPWMVGRNLLLAALALTLLIPTSPRGMSFAELAVAGAAVVTLAFLYPVVAIVLTAPPPTFDQNFHDALRTSARR